MFPYHSHYFIKPLHSLIEFPRNRKTVPIIKDYFQSKLLQYIIGKHDLLHQTQHFHCHIKVSITSQHILVESIHFQISVGSAQHRRNNLRNKISSTQHRLALVIWHNK